MANDTFATFFELSSLQFNDYLVGYRNLTETRVGYAGLVNTFVAAVSTDNEKINNTYSSLNSFSANWNSTYATVNANSANWEESSEILPTVVNYLSTNNVVLSAAIILSGLSATSIATNSLTSRNLTLLHVPENDGTNPFITIGETSSLTNMTTGFSGFRIAYDEVQNLLTVTSVFSGVSGAIVSVDRSGNTFGPVFPYTVTLTPFQSAAGNTSSFYPASLSGIIPGNEITSRIREAKGRIEAIFFFALAATAGTKNVILQFANNPTFTSATTIFQPTIINTTVNVVKSIYGYFVGNNIVFPSSSIASIYDAFTSAYVTYAYSGDLHYRVGFTASAVGQLCALSGAHISIVP